MKFVINGWREKSFFRQLPLPRPDCNRDTRKPAAPMGLSRYCVEPIPSYRYLRQQKNALIRRGMALYAALEQTPNASDCRIDANECGGLKFSQTIGSAEPSSSSSQGKSNECNTKNRTPWSGSEFLFRLYLTNDVRHDRLVWIRCFS
jgi:hypothetical protein